jgi:hypothetical protein
VIKRAKVIFLSVLMLLFIGFSMPALAQTPTPTYTPTPGGPGPTPTSVPSGTPQGYAFLFGFLALVGIWFILRHKEKDA